MSAAAPGSAPGARPRWTASPASPRGFSETRSRGRGREFGFAAARRRALGFHGRRAQGQIALGVRKQRHRAQLLVEALHPLEGAGHVLDALAEALQLRLEGDVFIPQRPVFRGAVEEVRVVDGRHGQRHHQHGAACEQLTEHLPVHLVAADGLVVLGHHDEGETLLGQNPGSPGCPPTVNDSAYPTLRVLTEAFLDGW